MGSKNILVWNVHGLNANGLRNVVRELVNAEQLSIVCLQETKHDVFNDCDIMQLMGGGFDSAYLTVIHTRGGIIVAWHSASWSTSNISTRLYSLSTRLHQAADGTEWWLMVVYGPSRDHEKQAFLAELHEL
jgi:exonuclease III